MAFELDAARALHEETVLRGPGKTPPSLRALVADGRDVPEALRVLVEKIDRHAYKVTDEDIQRLKSTYSEDELFEIVVSAAMGAAKRRLEAGLRALEEAE